MESKLGRLINTGVILLSMLAGSRSDTRITTADIPSTRTDPAVRQVDDYSIELQFTNGGKLFCRNNEPVGLQYTPPDSTTGSGPGSCDVLYSRDKIKSVTVNGQPINIPSASNGINPSQLIRGK